MSAAPQGNQAVPPESGTMAAAPSVVDTEKALSPLPPQPEEFELRMQAHIVESRGGRLDAESQQRVDLMRDAARRYAAAEATVLRVREGKADDGNRLSEATLGELLFRLVDVHGRHDGDLADRAFDYIADQLETLTAVATAEECEVDSNMLFRLGKRVSTLAEIHRRLRRAAQRPAELLAD